MSGRPRRWYGRRAGERNGKAPRAVDVVIHTPTPAPEPDDAPESAPLVQLGLALAQGPLERLARDLAGERQGGERQPGEGGESQGGEDAPEGDRG
jgi:hypothetical protein